MKKRWKITALIAAITLLLAGCGSNGISDALVISAGSAEDAAVTEVWAGIQSYASAGSLLAGRYAVDEDSDATFKEAVKAGAKSIVVMGSELDTALYRAQYQYKKVRFIGLDAQPRSEKNGEIKIADNTVCVAYDKGQLGFLAGYAAVSAGNQSLAFIGGTESDENKSYLGGFIAGAEKAAADGGAGAGSITVNVWYAGSDSLSPVVMDKALKLYDNGTTLIMANGENILTAVNEAAKKRNTGFISAGVDLTSLDRCVIGMTTDAAETARSLLKAADNRENSDFQGGSYVTCGASENSIKLVCKYDQLGSFSEESYQSLYASLSGGSITADNTGLSSTEHVTVTNAVS